MDTDFVRYSAKVVEAVTGYNAAMLRKFEERGIYVCELRRQSEHRLSILTSWDSSAEKAEAADTLRKLNTGWREFVFADLVRLTIIRRMAESGVALKVAREMALIARVFDEQKERHIALVERDKDTRPQILFYCPAFPNFAAQISRRPDVVMRELGRTRFPVFTISLSAVRVEVLLALVPFIKDCE